MSTPITVGIVGGGWRAEYFARLVRLLPERFTLIGAAARQTATTERITAEWGVRAYLSARELVAQQHPELVIVAVPGSSSVEVLVDLVDAGARVLSETPPAVDAGELRSLWAEIGSSGSVQVAEQYLLLPGHAARRELVARGVIGHPTSVQVSSTHSYHAVSIIRGMLGAGFDPVRVTASAFRAPLVDPLSRAGWTHDGTAKQAATTIATLDFGDRSGLYDFTDNQWHNQLRFRRIIVRGSHGEIADDSVVRLAGSETIVKSEITRSQLGYDLNLDGFDTEHLVFEGEVVYRNPFLGLRLMDEEIAIASSMVSAGTWARDEGPGPYSLAQASQDQIIGLAIAEASSTGLPVTTAREPWAGAS